VLRFSKACLLLVTFLSSVTFPAWPETGPDERSPVIVSVYNDAGVPESVLGPAEKRAARILAQAGVDVVWKDCSLSRKYVGPDALVRAGEQSSPVSLFSPVKESARLRPAGRVGTPAPTWSVLENMDCSRFEWPTHLAMRMTNGSRNSTGEVFGVAFLSAEGTGCYSDVFYDRTLQLHADWKVSLADILGSVMAHELGHLLLGSNSHAGTGIMKARWQGEELGLLSRGNLRFTSEQVDLISGRLSGARRTESLTALK